MKKVLAIAVIVGVLFLAFQALFGSGTVSWNQRLTLVIETPQGEVRGAAMTRVENVTSKGALVLAEARGTRSYWTGEAAAVEIGPGRWLFALLQGEGATDAGHWVYAAYDLGTAVGADGYPSYDVAMAKLRVQPMDVPVPLPVEGMPMLVTFDDITKPETVRRVDPDDLDAAFGCAQTEGIIFPWRDAGMIRRDWIETETNRLSREMAADRAGLTDPAAAALEELYEIVERAYAMDETTRRRRTGELRALFTREQQRQWEKARLELTAELPATLPSVERLTATVGGPCHRLKTVTLEITREAVTERQIKGVLGWLEPYPEPALGPATGGTTDIPFYRRVHMGDFIRRP